jgi:hypothetical protein
MGLVTRACAASIAAVLAATGCSAIAVRVPDQPPAPERCPHIAIVADVAGTAVFGLATAGAGYALYQNDLGAIVGFVTAPLFLVYGLSLWYGLSERSDCHRLQREEATQREQEDIAEKAREAADVAARSPGREDVVGDAPLYCYESVAVLGRCFFTEQECTAAAASGAGQVCDQRSRGWCLEVAGPDKAGAVVCAPTRADCAGRRVSLLSHKTLVVSTCSEYTVRPAAPPP